MSLYYQEFILQYEDFTDPDGFADMMRFNWEEEEELEIEISYTMPKYRAATRYAPAEGGRAEDIMPYVYDPISATNILLESHLTQECLDRIEEHVNCEHEEPEPEYEDRWDV